MQYYMHIYISIFCIVGGCETHNPIHLGTAIFINHSNFFDAEKTCISIEIHGRCPLPAIHGGCTLF